MACAWCVMAEEDSIVQLIHGVRRGDERAVQDLWDQVFPELCALAGRQLAGQRRGDSDEEDIAVSAIASFCAAARDDRFPDLKDRKGLWRLLSVMTRRKVVDLIRYRKGMRRGAGRVGGESALVSESGCGGLDNLPGEDLTPVLALLLKEETERLLRLLGDSTLQQLALWKLQGFTNLEIAHQLGCSVRTVDRRLQLVRRKWQ